MGKEKKKQQNKKCHTYGFSSLRNDVKNIVIAALKDTEHNPKIDKEKQISALIQSKYSSLLSKAGTASSNLLPLINLLTGQKHFFPKKHSDNIFKSTLIYGGICTSCIYSYRNIDKHINLQTSNT